MTPSHGRTYAGLPAARLWVLVLVAVTASLLGCHDEGPTGAGRDPELVVRGYDDQAGCIPEVVTAFTDSTQEILVPFTTTESVCYPNLVEWGIDMADPIGVDTPQGNGFFQIKSGSGLGNLPSPPNAAFGAYYTPSQVMIEFDPPVQSVQFYYSRLEGERARWGGQWVEADSMLVRAMSRYPGTTFYQTYDLEILYSNVPRATPPWDVWTLVTLTAPGDKIEWLWFDGSLVIDDLRIVRRPLTCSSPVTRGGTVECRVSAGDATVSGWRFTPADTSVPTVEDSSSSSTWRGTAVTPGSVTVTLSDGIAPRSFISGFSVSDRSSPWSSRQVYAETTQPLVPDVEPDIDVTLGRNCNVTGCADPMRILPSPFTQSSEGSIAARVDSGPNRGYWYVESSHWRMDRIGAINPAILSTSSRIHPLPGDTPKSCKKKLGFGANDPAAANFFEYNDKCKGLDMDAFVAAVWGHEGFGYNGGRGHESLARDAAAKPGRDPYKAVERLVTADSIGLMALVRSNVIPIGTLITLEADDASDTGEVSDVPGGNLLPITLWFWREAAMLFQSQPISGF